MKSKITSLDQVIDKIQDGSTIMMGGFFAVGTPIRSIEKLVEKGVKDLTIIAIANANAAGNFDFALLFQNHQIKKFITSHTGTTPVAIEQYKNGEIEIEYYPMGTWIEKIRAGGGGLGGVLTPTGIGTLMEQGKQNSPSLPMYANTDYPNAKKHFIPGKEYKTRTTLVKNGGWFTVLDGRVDQFKTITQLYDSW